MHRLLVSVLLAASITPAVAGCFEGLGCTDSERFRDRDLARLNCGNLWFVRNAIYDDNGYCFKTDDGISAFGNDDCRYRNVSSVPLNSFERHNIRAIKRTERRKGC